MPKKRRGKEREKHEKARYNRVSQRKREKKKHEKKWERKREKPIPPTLKLNPTMEQYYYVGFSEKSSHKS